MNKKLWQILMATCMTFICFTTAIPTYANESDKIIQQDGLELVLSTDKESYKSKESIDAKLRVTNVSDSVIKDVNLEMMVPDGFELKKGENSKIIDENLEPQESLELSVQLYPKNTVIPTPGDKPNDKENPSKDNGENTGAQTHRYIYGLLGLLSGGIVCILVIRSKRGKKLFTILLVGTMEVSLLNLENFSVSANENRQTKMLEISKTVSHSEKDVSLQGSVSYAVFGDDSQQVSYTRAEWVHKLMEVYGYPETEISEETSYFTDIEDSQFKDEINQAVVYGIIPVDTKIFKPNEPATREFGAVTTIHSLGFELGEDIVCDDNAELTYPKEAQLAIEFGLLSLENNCFNPQQYLTLDESNRMIEFITEATNSSNGNRTSDEIVYKDDVKQYGDELVVISDDGQTLVLERNKASEQIKLNDTFVVNGKTAYKALNIVESDTTISVQYIYPELVEFIDSMDLEGTAQVDFSKFEPAEGVEIVDNSEIETSGLMDDIFDIPEAEIGADIDINLAFSHKFDKDTDAAFSTTFKLPSVAYKFDVDFTNGINIHNSYIKLKQAIDLTGNIETSTEDNVLDNVVYTDITLGKVPIIGINGLGIVIELDVVLTASGEIALKMGENGVIGVQIYNNQPRSLSTFNPYSNFEVSAKVNAGIKTAILAEIFNKSLIELNLELGEAVEGDTIVRNPNLFCFDVYSYFYANSSLQMLNNIDITWNILTKDNSPLLISGHIENFQWMPECTYNQNGVVEGVIVEFGNPDKVISNATIQIYNETDKEPITEITSDKDGRFKMVLKEGIYIIQILARGYQPFETTQEVESNEDIFTQYPLMPDDTSISEESNLNQNVVLYPNNESVFVEE